MSGKRSSIAYRRWQVLQEGPCCFDLERQSSKSTNILKTLNYLLQWENKISSPPAKNLKMAV